MKIHLPTRGYATCLLRDLAKEDFETWAGSDKLSKLVGVTAGYKGAY